MKQVLESKLKYSAAATALAAVAAVFLFSGCAVVSVAGAAVSVASTAVSVTAGVAGVAADVAVGTVKAAGKVVSGGAAKPAD